MPTVTMAVMRGKRQNNHSIVAEETAAIAKNATMPTREDEEFCMPDTPGDK